MDFFLVLTQDGRISLSPFPEMDKPYGSNPIYLRPGLPLAYAEKIRNQVRVGRNSQAEIDKIIKRDSFLNQRSWKWHSLGSGVEDGPIAEFMNEEEEKEFIARVEGRLISEREFVKLARETGMEYSIVVRALHRMVRKDEAEWIPAVRKEDKDWRCQRCGETEIEEWPGAYGPAATCPVCAGLGSCSSLQVLWRSKSLTGKESKIKHRPLGSSGYVPYWKFTSAQEIASEQVVQFVKQGEAKEALLWAACGAGKTEVCFPAAAWALEHGQKVLFAAPRQDVILDVAPRLNRDFPGFSVAVLTGVTPGKFEPGSMVLATTHQILRFHQAFDLVFLDEMDAFPYLGSRMLEWGLYQSLKPGGKILFLSATPAPEKLIKAKRDKNLIYLPARHHRQPLPVPTCLKYPGFWDDSTCPEVFVQSLQKLVGEGPTFVFVPKVSWVEFWERKFRHHFSCWNIAGSHSKDPGRREKVEGLRRGLYNLFISTSILERGVTIPKAQVVVLAAEHPVFDERSLVQMAGRAGRTSEHPDGQVLFFYRSQTKAMKTAREWIEEQNRLAGNLGLLDD